MAKPESWLKRNIVAIVAATIAALGVAVIWYNGNKSAPPVQAAPMTATASSGGTAVNATSGATVQIGPSAAGQATSQPVSPPVSPTATTPAAASTPGAMHASAETSGTAVNATGSAQVTVHKTPAAIKP